MSNISLVTRRRFLSSASAAATISAAAPIGFLQSTVAANAFVEVVATHAVSALVGHAIAEYVESLLTTYGQTPSGVWLHKLWIQLWGPQPQAPSELQGITNQLASLQQQTAQILEKLVSLPSEIDLLLRLQSVRDLHRDVGTAITQYRREVNAISRYNSRDAWLAAPERKDNLRAVLWNLWNKRTSLMLSNFPVDPSAALTMSCACLAELNLMNALDYDPPSIGNRMTDYERYFLRVTNGQLAGSAMHYQTPCRAKAILS